MNDLTLRVFRAAGVTPEHPAYKAWFEKGARIVAIEDTHWASEDLEGDMFNPEVNSDIPAEKLAQERAEWLDSLETYGVWGLGIAIEPENPWEDPTPLYDTFVWGVEGLGSYLEDTAIERELLEAMASVEVNN